MLHGVVVDQIIQNALKEDISGIDITTDAIVEPDACGRADLICKMDGIICGISVFQRAFQLLDPDAVFQTQYHDGALVRRNEHIGTVFSRLRAILSGERTALNFLQRMSGISTMTDAYVKALEGTATTLLDTRKTTPGIRLFEKYAVKCGGGNNHRYNLSDGVLIKDNHIGAAGSIIEAVSQVRRHVSPYMKIEVEVENLDMLEEALQAKADIIMLDNMDEKMMAAAVKIINGRAQTECSGDVTLEKLKQIAETGVDYVSCGALTHSAPRLDFSLKNSMKI